MLWPLIWTVVQIKGHNICVYGQIKIIRNYQQLHEVHHDLHIHAIYIYAAFSV